VKINSMKFEVINFELLIITGVIVALFILEIPQSNKEILTLVLGALLNDVSHAINNMFHRRGKDE
jgi:hypothetical protein